MVIMVWILLLIITGLCEGRIHEGEGLSWNAWRLQFGKTYSSSNEVVFRKLVFEANRRFVLRHNRRYMQGLETYTTQLNRFSDLTIVEFADRYLKATQEKHSAPTRHIFNTNDDNVPTAVDWRTQGCVTSVKDQVSAFMYVHD